MIFLHGRFQKVCVLFLGREGTGRGDAKVLLEVGDHGVEVAVAIVGLPGRHLEDDFGELLGNPFHHEVGRRDLLRLMLGDHLHRRVAIEWRPAGHERIERASERINISAGVDRSGVSPLFGGHVRGGAHGDVNGRHLGAGDLRNARLARCSGLGPTLGGGSRGDLGLDRGGRLDQS